MEEGTRVRYMPGGKGVVQRTEVNKQNAGKYIKEAIGLIKAHMQDSPERTEVLRKLDDALQQLAKVKTE